MRRNVHHARLKCGARRLASLRLAVYSWFRAGVPPSCILQLYAEALPMHFRYSVSIPLLLLFALTAGACSSEPEAGATVGEIAIPAADLASMGEPERETLFDLVAFGAAVADGELDALSEPVLERVRRMALLEVMPFYLGAQGAGMDSTTLAAIYAANPDWELDVRHVVRLVEAGDPVALRDSARAVAQRVEREARAGADFAALAAEFSEEPGAARRGGRLEPGRRGSWVDPFWEAASALQPGQISPVVESEYGYHVLKLDDRRPVPFDEADQAAFYRRAVPVDIASGAMQQWVGENGDTQVDAAAVDTAREQLLEEGTVAPGLVLARGGETVYTGADLAAGWAMRNPDARRAAEQNPDEFARWVGEEARQAIWTKKAAAIGVPEPATIPAVAGWNGLLARWSAAFGFREGMSDEEVYAAARNATLSGAAEARAARNELRSLRPLLRARYPTALAAG